MPIVKHRENFSEILSRAASQKVVSEVRNTDALSLIQEHASTTSRRLSSTLVDSMRQRPTTNDSIRSVDVMPEDDEILEEVYSKLSLDFYSFTRSGDEIVNFDSFLRFTDTKDMSNFARRVFKTMNDDNEEEFKSNQFISGLWKFCPLDEVDLGLFIFNIYLEPEQTEWTSNSIECFIADISKGVSFNSQECREFFQSKLQRTNQLNRSRYMKIYLTNKSIFLPIRRWRMVLIRTCGGVGFWKEISTARYQMIIERSRSSSIMIRTLFQSNFVIISSFCYSIVKSKPFYVIRFFFGLMAFVLMIIQTSDFDQSNDLDVLVSGSEIAIDSYFIMEWILKLIAIKAYLQIKNTLGKNEKSIVMALWTSGVQAAVASILSLTFGTSAVGDWARLCRLFFLTSLSLRRLASIDVLMDGIVLGCRSLLSTWLLLLVVFIIYSACAMSLFGGNDPTHFGSMATSLFTFFQMSTFDGWGPIMYINTYGCDRFPSDYVMYDSTSNGGEGSQLTYKRFGTMYMAICHNPKAHPVIAPIFFTSFIVLSGFVLISLTVAVVTSGIHDRLGELKDTEEGVINRELNRIQMIRQDSNQLDTDFDERVLNNFNDGVDGADGGGGNETPDKVKTNAAKYEASLSDNKEMIRMILEKVWKDQDEYTDRQTGSHRSLYKRLPTTGAEIVAMIDYYDIFSWQNSSMLCRSINANPFYQYFQVVCIVLVVFLEIVSIERSNDANDMGIVFFQITFQLFFFIDVLIRLHAQYPNWKHYFHDVWNASDFALMLVTMIPVVTYNQLHDDRVREFVELLQVLRVLRILRLLNWIRDLNVILRAIADSSLALSYVIVLLFLFFFHFAIAGVFLFAQNDPYYFGNIGKSFITLFQVSTLDAWIVFARTNMYGCDLYGYQTGEDYFDLQCEHPHGLGWIAAFYFFCFIIFGTMVLLSLFIGILIASMEIIKQSMKDENSIWKKVSEIQTQREYINSTTVANLLEVFDLIDVGANGILTLIELKPLLEIVSKDESAQYGIFLKVDKDYSGCVDFAEFLEFIHHLGVEYRQMKREESKKSSPKMRKEKKKKLRTRLSDSAASWSLRNLNVLLMASSSSPKVEANEQDDEGNAEEGGNNVEDYGVSGGTGAGAGAGGRGGLLQRLSSSIQRSFSMSNDAKLNSKSRSRSGDREGDTEGDGRKGSTSNILNMMVSNVSGRNARVSCAVDLPIVKSKRANTGTWPMAVSSIKEEGNSTKDNMTKPKEKSKRRVVNSQLSFPRDVDFSDNDDDNACSPLGKSSPTATALSQTQDSQLELLNLETSTGSNSVMNHIMQARSSSGSSLSGDMSRYGHVVSTNGEIEIVNEPLSENPDIDGGVDGLRWSGSQSPAHISTGLTCSSSTSPRSTRFIHINSNEENSDNHGSEDQSVAMIQNHVKNYKRKSRQFICHDEQRKHGECDDIEE